MFGDNKLKSIRNDFPMFKNTESVYFDNAATTFKPQIVIDKVIEYYTHTSVNVGRADYLLAYNVEMEVEQTRAKVAEFINAKKDEIIFTSGASESLNLVAYSYGLNKLKKGDVILTTKGEHASNLLPWFKVAEATGALIKYIDLDSEGNVLLANFKANMSEDVKVVSIAGMTNVLGNINPIKEISKIAHQVGAIVVCDGAQSVPHMVTDVKDLGVDFLAFSAHKMLGPTGVGVLYGKYSLLEDIFPFYEGGGSNARYLSSGEVTHKKPPYKFESGTLPIEGILGFKAALDYLNKIGMDKIEAYEKYLTNYLLSEMKKLDNVIIYNPNVESGIVAFNVKDIFSQDVASYLDSQGILVRSGHHCSKIINNVIGANDTLRASIYFYNTKSEVDKFIAALKTATIENCIDLFV